MLNPQTATQIAAGRKQLRECIQKVATGPEYSKDLSLDEAQAAMAHILSGQADEVQAGVFLIALRMKRESIDENKGILKAILEATHQGVAAVDEVFDIGDPYDGFTRGVPVASFLPVVLASLGIPAVCHGVEAMGPKYGVTHKMVLRAAGIPVDLSVPEALQRVNDPEFGWAYVDQSRLCPGLYALMDLRTRIVKRPCLTTVEVLLGPIRGRQKTHLMTGYVHKAYPPVYAELARFAGFNSALMVRGVEGGVIPSLQQEAKIYRYQDFGPEESQAIDPKNLGIMQAQRAVPLPQEVTRLKAKMDTISSDFDCAGVATYAARMGQEALAGQPGPVYDALVYGASLCLTHLNKYSTLAAASQVVRQVLDSGQVYTRFRAFQ